MGLTVSELAFVFGADSRKVDKALLDVDAKAKSTASSMSRSMTASWKKTGEQASSIFRNVEKGAAVAGVGAGRRFGTALHETLGEYAKTIGATMLGFFAYEKVKEFFTGMIEEGQKAGATARVTEQVIKSTGEAAGVTAAHVEELSAAISKKVGVDADSVHSSANMLLTFKNVRDEVGKGNDIFDQATQAVVDMSSVMAGSGGSGGGDSLKGAAIQIGKALNDPIRGLTALQRVGVTFDADTKSRIKSLVAEGKTMQAQKIILRELKSEFGGAAAAASDPIKQAKADWMNMEAELGQHMMPTLGAVAGVVTNEVIPGFEAAGSEIGDLIHDFQQLSPEVKGAIGGFVAMRTAAALGLTANLRASLAGVGSQMVSLRLRSMFAADAFRTSVAGGAGRATAALAGLRAGAVGAGAGLKGALSGALGIVGGPWGAAFIGATAVAVHFWHAHQDAKKYVDDLTRSLNQQTGAITENTTKTQLAELQKNGAIDLAKKYGISLDLVRRTTMGGTAATREFNQALDVQLAALQGSGVGVHQAADDLQGLRSKVTGAAGALTDAQGNIASGASDLAEFQGKANDALNAGADATDGATRGLGTYATQLENARTAVDKLRLAEDKRRTAHLKNRRDRLALVQSMQATSAEASNTTEVADINSQISDARKSGADERANLRDQLAHTKSAKERAKISREIAASTADEAKKVADLNGQLKQYTKTLDIHTKAGQANLSALYDLADQWNNSSTAVRRSKGMYEQVRAEFIKDAMTMGDTRAQAKKLADDILSVPKGHEIDIKTPGMKQALEDIKKLHDEIRGNRKLAISVSDHMAGDRRLEGHAGGGWLGGPGGPRDDKAGVTRYSRGEFMVNAAAASKHGRLLEAVNRGEDPGMSQRGGGYGSGTDIAAAVAAGIQAAGHIAPLMQVGTLTHTDMRETERHLQTLGVLAAAGG